MSKLAPAFFTLITLCIYCIPSNARGPSDNKQNQAVKIDNCMREKAKTIPEEKKQRKVCLEELGIESKKLK